MDGALSHPDPGDLHLDPRISRQVDICCRHQEGRRKWTSCLRWRSAFSVFSLSLFPPLLSPSKRASVRLFRSRAARHTYALAQLQDSLWDGGPEIQEETVRQTFFHPEWGGGQGSGSGLLSEGGVSTPNPTTNDGTQDWITAI